MASVLIVALVVPDSFSPLAAAAVLGVICYLAWSVISARETARADGVAHIHNVGQSSRAASLKIGFWLVATSALLGTKLDLRAQDIVKPEAPSRLVYPVLIPVDENRKVLPDEKYQVPVELYDQLLKRSEQLQARPRGWLWRSASYNATMAWDPAARKYIIAKVRSRFELSVLDSNRMVRLPLDGTKLAEIPQTALLDGRQVAITSTVKGMEFAAPPPGQYRIEIDLVPVSASANGYSGIDLPIPPVPQSQFLLSLPPDAPEVVFSSHLGAARNDKPQRRLRVDLGATDRLAARWRNDSAFKPEANRVRSEQMLWLKVLPGSAVLDVRLKCQVERGTVQRLLLLTNPRLRLLRLRPSGQQPTGRLRDLGGNPRSYELTFVEPISEDFVVDASFLLEGTSGVGNLRIPQLELVDVSVQQRWMALSVHRSLETVLPNGNEIASDRFLAAWGSFDPTLVINKAYDFANIKEPIWTVSTRPTSPTKTAEQMLYLSAKERRIDARLEAWITTSGAPSFEHHVRVPTDFVLESVFLQAEDAPRTVRWSRDQDGQHVTIRLSTPALGRQRLVLEGWLPAPTPGSHAIPTIRVDGAELSAAQVIVLRRPDVQVQLKDLKGLELQTAGGSDHELGHFVAALQATDAARSFDDPSAMGGTLEIQPNRPVVRAKLVTSMYREQDSGRWIAEVDYRPTDIQGGTLDVIRFEVPKSWKGPFEVTPSMPLELVEIPGHDRNQLVLTPAKPIREAFRVVVRSRLPVSSEDRVRAPRVIPLEVNKLEHYLVLQTHFELTKAFWHVDGLQTVRMLKDYDTLPPRTFPSVPRDSQTLSGEFAFRLIKRGGCRACGWPTSMFSGSKMVPIRASRVSTSKARESPLAFCSFPSIPRARLILIDGRPANAIPVADASRQWNIRLGASQYPQRLEVVYQGQAQVQHGYLAGLTAPRLEDLPVEQTFWTLHGCGSWQLLDAAGKTPLTPVEQELERLSSFDKMVHLATDTAIDEPVSEILDWYRPWSAWMEQSEKWLGQQASTAARKSRGH